jgi:hypothetical protein
MMDASSRHLAVDDATAAAPPSQDAVFGPVCPEVNVSAKANNQTMMIVARAIVKGRSLRSSNTIPSKELDCLTVLKIAASPLEPPLRSSGWRLIFCCYWSMISRASL